MEPKNAIVPFSRAVRQRLKAQLRARKRNAEMQAALAARVKRVKDVLRTTRRYFLLSGWAGAAAGMLLALLSGNEPIFYLLTVLVIVLLGVKVVLDIRKDK